MKKVLAILLILMLCLTATACASKPAGDDTVTPPAEGDKPLSIGYMGMSATTGFWKEMYDSIKAACDERGWEITAQFTDYDPVKMRAAYDQFKMMDVDAIIDGNAVVDMIRPFAEEGLADGIPYVSLFVALDEPSYTFGASKPSMGKAVGTYIGELVKKEWGGELDGVMLVGTFTTNPANIERLTTAVPAMEAIIGKEIANIVEIDAQTGDTASTYQRTMSALTTNPGRYAVFCQTDDIANAVFEAVEAAGRGDDIMGTGSDCIQIALEYFKEAVDSNDMTVPWRGSIFLNTKLYGPMILDLCQDIINGTAAEYAAEPPVEVGGIYNLYELFPDLKD